MGRVSHKQFFYSRRKRYFEILREYHEVSYFEMPRDYRRGFLMRPGDACQIMHEPAIEVREPSASEYRRGPLARPGDVLDNGHTRKRRKHRHKTP